MSHDSKSVLIFFSTISFVELLAILRFFTQLKIHNIPRACTIKHYVLIMHMLRSKLVWLYKLVCLSEPVKVTNNKNTLKSAHFLKIQNPS